MNVPSGFEQRYDSVWQVQAMAQAEKTYFVASSQQTYVCMYLYIYILVYIYMYVSRQVGRHACMYVWHVYTVYTHTRTYIYIYICVHVCKCIYIFKFQNSYACVLILRNENNNRTILHLHSGEPRSVWQTLVQTVFMNHLQLGRSAASSTFSLLSVR